MTNRSAKAQLSRSKLRFETPFSRSMLLKNAVKPMFFMNRLLPHLLISVFLIFFVTACSHDGNSPTTPSRRSQLTYVAMGASDAVGIGAFPLDEGYVYKIRDGLSQFADTVELTNLGVSGERIKYIEETALPTAIARDPDVVTLWLGRTILFRERTRRPSKRDLGASSPACVRKPRRSSSWRTCRI